MQGNLENLNLLLVLKGNLSVLHVESIIGVSVKAKHMSTSIVGRQVTSRESVPS